MSSKKVGIGKTNPIAKLDVLGDIALTTTSSTIKLQCPASGTGTYILPDHTDAADKYLKYKNGGEGTLEWAQLDSDKIFLGDSTISIAGETISMTTSGTERLTILPTGQIGIGITNPISKLDVAGDIALKNNSDSANNGYKYYKFTSYDNNDNTDSYSRFSEFQLYNGSTMIWGYNVENSLTVGGGSGFAGNPSLIHNGNIDGVNEMVGISRVNGYLIFYFSSSGQFPMTKFRFSNGNNESQSGGCTKWTMEGSNNGSDWDMLVDNRDGSISNNPKHGQWAAAVADSDAATSYDSQDESTFYYIPNDILGTHLSFAFDTNTLGLYATKNKLSVVSTPGDERLNISSNGNIDILNNMVIVDRLFAELLGNTFFSGNGDSGSLAGILEGGLIRIDDKYLFMSNDGQNSGHHEDWLNAAYYHTTSTQYPVRLCPMANLVVLLNHSRGLLENHYRPIIDSNFKQKLDTIRTGGWIGQAGGISKYGSEYHFAFFREIFTTKNHDSSKSDSALNDRTYPDNDSSNGNTQKIKLQKYNSLVWEDIVMGDRPPQPVAGVESIIYWILEFSHQSKMDILKYYSTSTVTGEPSITYNNEGYNGVLNIDCDTYIDGKITNNSGNLEIGCPLDVNGRVSIADSLGVDGKTSIGGDLEVMGNIQSLGTLKLDTINGNTDTNSINIAGIKVYNSNQLDAHRIIAQNYRVGSRNIVSASAQGSFLDIELKESGGDATVLAYGETGNMQLSGTLKLDTIKGYTDTNSINIAGIKVYNSDQLNAHTIIAQNYRVGSRNIVSASAQGSFLDLELKESGGDATVLADGATGNMDLSGILTVDTINEKTADNGVVIDGSTIKDGTLTINTINEQTANNGVVIEGSTIKDGTLTMNTINEQTANNGVVIDGSTIKDGTLTMNTINEQTANNGVVIEGSTFKDGNLGIGLDPQYAKLQLDGNILLAGGVNGHDTEGSRYVGIHGTSGAIGYGGFSGIEIASSGGSQSVHIHTHRHSVASRRHLSVNPDGYVNVPYYLHVGTTSVAPAGYVPTGDVAYNVTGKIPFYCTKTTSIHGTYTQWMNTHNYYFSNGLSEYNAWGIRPDGYYYGNINVVGMFQGSIQVSGNIHMYSDRRIKKEIVDANDDGCLNIIRQIKNRKYKYIDPFSDKESNNEVYGFIAQEVKELIPEAVGRTTDFIPSIMMEGDVVSNPDNNNQYYITTSTEFTIENTLEGQVYIKSYEINYDEDKIHTLKFISQENTKKILVEYNNSLPDRLFLYGELVYDFHTLDKNKIYTISVGAVQEIDRRQQADKEKIANLENELLTLKEQYNNLLSRIVALENK